MPTSDKRTCNINDHDNVDDDVEDDDDGNECFRSTPHLGQRALASAAGYAAQVHALRVLQHRKRRIINYNKRALTSTSVYAAQFHALRVLQHRKRRTSKMNASFLVQHVRSFSDTPSQPAGLRKGVAEERFWERGFEALVKMTASEKEIILFFPTVRVELGELVHVSCALHGPI